MTDIYLPKYAAFVTNCGRWLEGARGITYDNILGPCWYMSSHRPDDDTYRTRREVLEYRNRKR